MPKYTDAELAQLTEEERAGLIEGDEEETVEDGAEGDEGAAAEDADAGKTEETVVAAEGDEGEPAVEGTEGAETVAPAPGVKTVAEGATQFAAEGGVESEEPGDETIPGYKPRPIPAWAVPEGSGDRLDAITERKNELATKFDEGEIDRAEYTREVNALDKERGELQKAIDRHEMARDMAITEWGQSAVPAFIEAHPMYKDQDGPLYSMLDAEVRKLQSSGKYDSPFDQRILMKAHRNIEAAIKGVTGAKQETAPDPKPAAAAKKPSVGAQPGTKREIPPTLNQIPAVADADIGEGGKFAYLDRLMEQDGVAYEKELAKLSDADKDAYLQQ